MAKKGWPKAGVVSAGAMVILPTVKRFEYTPSGYSLMTTGYLPVTEILQENYDPWGLNKVES